MSMSYVVGTFTKRPGCSLYPTRGDSCWDWVSLHAGEVQIFLSIAKSIILSYWLGNKWMIICTQVEVRKAAYGAYAPILTADKLALVHINTLSPSSSWFLIVWIFYRWAGRSELLVLASCLNWAPRCLLELCLADMSLTSISRFLTSTLKSW